MIINNEIVKDFLKCEYKSYLKYYQNIGEKTEYECMESELLERCKTKFYQKLCLKCNDHQILPQITFTEECHHPGILYAIHTIFQIHEYDIYFDAIEASSQKQPSDKFVYVPIDVIYQEHVSKAEKLSLAVRCLILSKF